MLLCWIKGARSWLAGDGNKKSQLNAITFRDAHLALRWWWRRTWEMCQDEMEIRAALDDSWDGEHPLCSGYNWVLNGVSYFKLVSNDFTDETKIFLHCNITTKIKIFLQHRPSSKHQGNFAFTHSALQKRKKPHDAEMKRRNPSWVRSFQNIIFHFMLRTSPSN